MYYRNTIVSTQFKAKGEAICISDIIWFCFTLKYVTSPSEVLFTLDVSTSRFCQSLIEECECYI